tara:strand:- start:3541 stop:4749 length:1209 start_codon:yes stop_codon:yes gene_type:complete
MTVQTTALRKIAGLRKKIRVVRGGQGSGKTISILILLVNHASGVADREVLILSAELTKMRLTVIKDFVKVMKAAGIWQEHRFIAGTLYRFPNGSFIKFIGLDKEDVGKGLRSHAAYFNEVNKCGYESYRQVATRADNVYMDYNPDAVFFVDDDVIPREDCDFIQLTFQDNELLPQSERDEILNYHRLGYGVDYEPKRTVELPIINSYWANLWQVYGLGNIGSLEGVIFNNWSIIDVLPIEAKLLGTGLDFGFTADPTAAVDVYQHEGKYILDEAIYETGLLNSEIADRLKQRAGTTIADSAEPKSIEEIRRLGIRIKGAEKGADSIRFGIQLMQEHEWLVTSRSINLINELRTYTWEIDKRTGKQTGNPIGINNHACDAWRYWVLANLHKKYNFKKPIKMSF